MKTLSTKDFPFAKRYYKLRLRGFVLLCCYYSSANLLRIPKLLIPRSQDDVVVKRHSFGAVDVCSNKIGLLAIEQSEIGSCH